MNKLFGMVTLGLFASLVLPAIADSAPAPSATLLKAAEARAKKENKVVFVKFEATWCGWCHKLTDALNEPTNKKIMDKYFVLVVLDVMENGAKKAVENPGGMDYLKELGGEKSGLPFYAFINADGKKIADSNVMPKNMNIGYPGEPEEIVAFEQILKKASPKMASDDVKKLISYFKNPPVKAPAPAPAPKP